MTWRTMIAGDQAETDVREAAERLAAAKADLLTEYCRHYANGDNGYVAQKLAEVVHGRAVTMAEAEYQIALSRLRR